MASVVENDSSLAMKCLDICQALTSQGKIFNFSLSIGPTFSFSFDSRDKTLDTRVGPTKRKKQSPSTLRRNAMRKEDYLNKRKQPLSAVKSTAETAPPSRLSCDQCDYTNASEKGLRQHKRMKKHGLSKLASSGDSDCQATPEKTRTSSSSASLAVSPIGEASKEVSCQDCENDECSTHCCETHKCAGCEMIFNNHDDMNDHMLKTHPFLCHICHLDCVDYDGKFKHHNSIHLTKYP